VGAAFTLGVLGAAAVVVSGTTLSGGDPRPSAVLLGVSYLVAVGADRWGPQLFE
jgi:hypothetical protein